MFIRLSKHRALVAQLHAELDAFQVRKRMLESANAQLNQEVIALRKFLEAEGLHQRCCATLERKACDCRLSRAGRLP